MSFSAVNTIPSPRLVDAGARVLTPTFSPGANPDHEALERSFDFLEFPKLKEANFSHAVWQMGKGPPWIPIALSALSPTTSPHLSSVRLAFPGSPSNLTPEFSIKDMGTDLQRIADQVTRIERGFEGAANFMAVLDPKFKAVSNIRCPM